MTMSKSVISYDKDLPAIEGRCAWLKPDKHLVKDGSGWRAADGRRQSRLLLVTKIRAAVDAWRDGGYPGASETTRRLFNYWFAQEHILPATGAPFHYHFCQREAVETLAWLVEIAKQGDAEALIKQYGAVHEKDLVSDNFEIQTAADGRRQIIRYVPEQDKKGTQDLPPPDLRRFAFKLATGSGKTWVMAMLMVWAHFHKKQTADSPLSANFLIVAPNVIVYQRLEGDFADNRIFNTLPLIPPEWRDDFSQKVILRGEAGEPGGGGNLFLTNIQQLYESRLARRAPHNPADAMLGSRPANALISGQRPMLERIKSLPDLIVINDEAHHVHEDELQWTKSLLAVHEALPRGLAAWLDFSATPKDQNGMYFPWTVADYPLAQAVEDRIVKSPLIVTMEGDADCPAEEPADVSAKNVVEKYGYWLQAAVKRWEAHHNVYKALGIRPVLFIMAEKNVYADKIGAALHESAGFPFKEEEVLVIHTDTAGEITKKDLDKAREAARDIDNPKGKIKAVVSVMMLREGWDVRNVSVVLGLRPFSAKAEILPEQVIGRGLRLMQGVGPDIQPLEVLGTQKLLEVLRNQLEAEGVGVSSAAEPPPKPIIIMPMKNRLQYDIAVPLTKPVLMRDERRLDGLQTEALSAIYEQAELEESFRINLKTEFAPTKTIVSIITIPPHEMREWEILSDITAKVVENIRLPGLFVQLYPIVRAYIADRCFGQTVDLDNKKVRSYLDRLEMREGIAKYLSRKIAERITVERARVEFDNADYRLSQTKRFSWRRNLKPKPLEAVKTVFNYVATYNDFERAFAVFMDAAPDVLRFAALGTTEQGDSGAQFRVDYLKPDGAIGFYHPDWAAVQKTGAGEINWIIETKGRVWEDTELKDDAMQKWCARISDATGRQWRFMRVNQYDFEKSGARTLQELVKEDERVLSQD